MLVVCALFGTKKEIGFSATAVGLPYSVGNSGSSTPESLVSSSRFVRKREKSSKLPVKAIKKTTLEYR